MGLYFFSSSQFRGKGSAYLCFLPLFLALFLGCAFAVCSAADGGGQGAVTSLIVPDRGIQLKSEVAVPWKITWDKARLLVRAGKLREAVELYQALLADRPGLEAAQWELAQIFLDLSEPDRALPLLELLVDSFPLNFDYLFALAATTEAQGNFGRAVELFKKLLVAAPKNPAVLTGIADGLLEQKKNQEAVTFLERLYGVVPEQAGLKEKLALLYYELGMYDQARPLLAGLAAEPGGALEVLRITARVHDRLGLTNLAADFWQRLIGRDAHDAEARAWLTGYFLKEGKGEDALPYLLPLLQKEPNRADLLKRIGQIYLGLTRFAEALSCFERYVEIDPENKEVLRLVVDIHAALGNKGQSVAALERFLSLEKEPDLAHLSKAAQLYEANGRFVAARALYDRILAITPDDPEVLAKRARCLLGEGNEAEASAMWNHLARRRKLLEVLEVLHALEPANLQVMEKLALMYLDQGALDKSFAYFERLSRSGLEKPDLLAAYATVCERLGYAEHALGVYGKLLAQSFDSAEVFLKYIRLAGQLGLRQKIHEQSARLRDKFPVVFAAPATQLVLARALCGAGSYLEARRIYFAMLDRADIAGGKRYEALLGLADLYRLSGLVYEAEGFLRQAYLEDGCRGEALVQLAELALDQRRVVDAGVWLDELTACSSACGQGAGANYSGGATEDLLRARFLAGEGETRKAVNLLRVKLEAHPGEQGGQWAAGREIKPALVQMLLGDNRFAEAERLLSSLAAADNDLEGQVLGVKLLQAQGEEQAAHNSFSAILARAGQDGGMLLDLVGILKKLQMYGPMLTAAEEVYRRLPESTNSVYLLAEAKGLNGRQEESVALLQAVAMGGEPSGPADILLAEQLFLTGRFDQALVHIERAKEQWGERPDLQLVEARILWAGRQWDAALAVYRDFLTPDLLEEFAGALKGVGYEFPADGRRNFWQKLTDSAGNRENLVDELQAPPFFVAAGRKEISDVTSRFYAPWQWRKRFVLELQARRAVHDREYFAAQKYFSRLLRDYPAETSLVYDLAGVQSRLGLLDKEAALYDGIPVEGDQFPGLAAARQRNSLKLRPRTAISHGYAKKEGRDGYMALAKSWEELSFWYAPLLRHEFDLSLARVEYRDAAGDSKIRGTRSELTYLTDVNQYLQLVVGGGVESLGDGKPDTALARCEISGRLGDLVSGGLGFRRDVKHDTLASLSRHVVARDLTAKVQVDLLSSLQVGGDYLYSDLSDDNVIQGYDLWASYTIFFDPAFLQFRYTYDFKDSKQGAQAGPLLSDGFAADDHPYWAPVNYWLNRFSVYFKHRLSDDEFKRGVPRYYDAEYIVSYGSRGYAAQSWKGGFFVEWTPHFIMKASAGITSGQEYRAKELFLAAIYRW